MLRVYLDIHIHINLYDKYPKLLFVKNCSKLSSKVKYKFQVIPLNSSFPVKNAIRKFIRKTYLGPFYSHIVSGTETASRSKNNNNNSKEKKLCC